jgi:hypothetical protein
VFGIKEEGGKPGNPFLARNKAKGTNEMNNNNRL